MQPNPSQQSLRTKHPQSDRKEEQPCWQKIGIWGDRTCEILQSTTDPTTKHGKLANIVHCQDCSTFVHSGLQLLQRPVSAAYLAERTQQLAAIAPRSDAAESVSMLIFRLGEEWLSLRANVCQQIIPVAQAHTLPHRTNSTLLGVVNVRGQLLLKVSLGSVLSIAQNNPSTSYQQTGNQQTGNQQTGRPQTKVYPRMVVIDNTPKNAKKKASEKASESWVFEVDELSGVYAIAREHMILAANAENAGGMTCVQTVFTWQGKQVSTIEENRLFEALRQQAL